MARHPGRAGAGWRRARKSVLEGSSVCAICGYAIDFDASPRSRWAPSVDHRVSLRAMRGMSAEVQRELALDPSNLQAAHYGCNSRRGDGQRPVARRSSRVW